MRGGVKLQFPNSMGHGLTSGGMPGSAWRLSNGRNLPSSWRVNEVRRSIPLLAALVLGALDGHLKNHWESQENWQTNGLT